MALKTLIFGTDDLYPTLKPFYNREAQRGNLEIAAHAIFENGGISLVYAPGKLGQGGDDSPSFELAIISSQYNFYQRMKVLENHGFPRNRIIDGRVFQVPNLDFPRLLNEGVACSSFNKNYFKDLSFCIYPRIYSINNSVLKFGVKSYMDNSFIDGDGIIYAGNFTSISWNITFELGLNKDHNKINVMQYGLSHMDWRIPLEFILSPGICQINIGSDVWIGRGCFLKCSNPNKPLIIGDGAVIASDSVVVKNVPPYAIVGGNPAQIIKYRFPENIIESLLRIKWWDWDIDKIHENFKYFNDIEKFISLHDK